MGPGLVVMFADTEVGSVIAAAQGGAAWGYRLLLFQLLLIPFLYMAQELAVRLGISSGKGFTELIKLRFNKFTSFMVVATLVISCFGALITQMSGLVGVGQIFGIPAWLTVILLIGLILSMFTTGSYRSVEKIAILLGTFELAFIFIAWKSHPNMQIVLSQIKEFPIQNKNYLYLLAANIGTCIIPWAIFYQQSAAVDKKLKLADLKIARMDTLIGAIICQVITAAILVAAATTFNHGGQSIQLDNIPQIASAFTNILGKQLGNVIFMLALSGGALVATIVVCLAAAWAIGEAMGLRHSLEYHPMEAPRFYGSFALMLILGGALAASGVNLIQLSLAAAVANAILLPIILYFLYHLAKNEIKGEHALKGGYSLVIGLSFLIISAVGLFSSFIGIFG
jgi:Mn2+/Fe2+ NRAMP family transporter